MKKRKKYNYQKAKLLKESIINFTNLVDLPTINDINLKMFNLLMVLTLLNLIMI